MRYFSDEYIIDDMKEQLLNGANSLVQICKRANKEQSIRISRKADGMAEARNIFDTVVANEPQNYRSEFRKRVQARTKTVAPSNAENIGYIQGLSLGLSYLSDYDV